MLEGFLLNSAKMYFNILMKQQTLLFILNSISNMIIARSLGPQTLSVLWRISLSKGVTLINI